MKDIERVSTYRPKRRDDGLRGKIFKPVGKDEYRDLAQMVSVLNTEVLNNADGGLTYKYCEGND